MAENRKIVPNTGHPPMRPVAYHYYAQEYYNTYINLGKRRKSYSPVPYTLLFHAIELELKSFLLESGKSNEDIRNCYKHNLTKIYRDLRDSDRILNTPEEINILKQSTNLLINKEYQFYLPEVIFRESEKMPDLEELETATVKLIQHGERIYKNS